MRLVGTDPDADWRQPPEISPAAKAEALALSKRLTKSLDEGRAENRVAMTWLAQVGILSAGKMSVDEAKARISAYVALLDFPAVCYGPESLKRAGSKFKFFPSFAEVEEHLSREVWWVKAQAYRLQRIGAEPKPDPAKPAPKRDAAPIIAEVVKATAPPREKSNAELDAEFQAQKAAVLADCERAGMGGA